MDAAGAPASGAEQRVARRDTSLGRHPGSSDPSTEATVRFFGLSLLDTFRSKDWVRAAGSGAAPSPDSPAPITIPSLKVPMDNVALLKSLYAAFGRGDIPTVLGAMSPDIRWHLAEGNPYQPGGEAWIGPDAVLNNLFLKLGAEWEPFALHPKTYYDAGSSVIVELRYGGINKATGKSIDVQVCHIWDLQDGKVTRFQQYMDTAQYRDAFGAGVPH